MMLCYAAFRITSSPAIHSQHAEALHDAKDARFSYTIGTVLNSAMIFIAMFGLLAIEDTEEYAESSLPVMTLIDLGLGGLPLTTLLSILIIFGCISPAVNMISAGSVRICRIFDKNFDPNAKPTKKAVLTTLIMCLAGWAIAQFGLFALVQKGYGFMAYATCPIVLVPYVVIVILNHRKTKKGGEKAAA